MKKLILISLSTVVFASLYASSNKKDLTIKVPRVDTPRVYLNPPPQCPSNATSNNNTEIYASAADIPPYKHCVECNLGALLGEKDQEKCTYCGVSSKKYHTIVSGD